MACRIVSSDPEFILNMLCMREIEENGEVMKPKESEGDEMGNNNELRDNGKDGGMDVDSDEGGGMNVDSVPKVTTFRHLMGAHQELRKTLVEISLWIVIKSSLPII